MALTIVSRISRSRGSETSSSTAAVPPVSMFWRRTVPTTAGPPCRVSVLDGRRSLAAAVAAAAMLFLLAGGGAAQAASTHRSACHTKHACPSDHHTYAWGSKRLWCTSYASERTARDTIRVRYGGRTYWCRKTKR